MSNIVLVFSKTQLTLTQAFYVSIVMYNATLMSIKFTFLLQYHRVFRVRKIHKPVLVIGVLIGCWTLSQLLTVIFSCSPIRKFWDRDMPGTCIPNLPLWYINAAGNVATDLAIFVLPLPVLKNLNLPRPQKILLMGIFSLGLFVSFIVYHKGQICEYQLTDLVCRHARFQSFASSIFTYLTMPPGTM